MKYINNYKLYESGHWKNDLISKLEWDKSYDIKQLTYDLQDLGFQIIIHNKILDEMFNEPSKKSDFFDTRKNIYKAYYIIMNDTSYDGSNIDRIIEIKENEIMLLNRLQELNFKIKIFKIYSNDGIYVYSEEDIIDKNHYIYNDESKFKKSKLTIDIIKEKLFKNFSSIADIHKTVKQTVILIPNSEKYTLNDLYQFVIKATKLHKDLITIQKVSIYKNNPEESAIEISLK